MGSIVPIELDSMTEGVGSLIPPKAHAVSGPLEPLAVVLALHDVLKVQFCRVWAMDIGWRKIAVDKGRARIASCTAVL